MQSMVSKFSTHTNSSTVHGLVQPIRNVHEPTRLADLRTRAIVLEVDGQGTVSCNIKKMTPRRSSSNANGTMGVIQLKNQDRPSKSILELHVSNSDITLDGLESWRFKGKISSNLSNLNLLYCQEPSKYLWISINRNNPCIKVGHGYMLESNTLIKFEPKSDSDREPARQVIEQIKKVKLGEMWTLVSPIKYWRLPVTRDPPHIVIESENSTLATLDSNAALTSAWLPMEANRLYSDIRSSHLRLTEEDVKRINYSIKTRDCSLYNTLKIKERKSNASISKNTSYIRVGMGEDVGDSVGHPFVLELWPIGHESPIHGHGDAVAIIKVLHGAIEVSFYNPLVAIDNQEQQPIKSVVLNKGDITWMSSEFYQTHKLRNLRKDTMAATIQCYSYLGTDTHHNEQFNYVSELDRKMYGFRPTSDYTYQQLMTTVEEDYAQRPRVSTKKMIGFFCVTAVTDE